MPDLYVLQGSKHSAMARTLITNRGVPCNVIVVSEPRILVGLNRDLGIRRLPALCENSTCYEGLNGIKSWLSQIEPTPAD